MCLKNDFVISTCHLFFALFEEFGYITQNWALPPAPASVLSNWNNAPKSTLLLPARPAFCNDITYQVLREFHLILNNLPVVIDDGFKKAK